MEQRELLFKRIYASMPNKVNKTRLKLYVRKEDAGYPGSQQQGATLYVELWKCDKIIRKQLHMLKDEMR